MYEKFEEKTLEIRKWFLIVPNYSNFGPYTSEEIYVFLTNLFSKNPELKENHTFMVADADSDIYFQPSSIIEKLEEEVKDKIKPLDAKSELEKIILNKTNKQKPPFRERKFSDNSKLITKYDVCEMNSKFKNAHFLPLKQLKQQLKTLKNKQNMQNNENNNFNNNFVNYSNNPNYNQNFNVDVRNGVQPRVFENIYNNKFNLNYQTPRHNFSHRERNNFNFSSQIQDNFFQKNTCEVGSGKALPHVKLISIKEKLFD